MKVLHWSELPGNKYLLKLDPAMLENRFFTEQTIRQVGVSRSESPVTTRVHYDCDYAITKILRDVLQPLKIDSLEQLLALMTEVWNESQNTHLDYESYKAGGHWLLRLRARGES